MKKTLIFVYGSLKSGYGNNIVLDDSTFIDFHATNSKYTMYDLGAFPAVALGGKSSITGEIYSVSDEILNAVDVLEGVDHDFYKRHTISTKEYGDVIMYVITDAYMETQETHDVIKDGTWDNPFEELSALENEQNEIAFAEYNDDEDSYKRQHRWEY